MSDTLTPVKRTTKRKTSTTAATATTIEPSIDSTKPKNVKVVSELFGDLLSAITDDKASFGTLQKEILEIRESWIKEQVRHEVEVRERDLQEELERRREREAYTYDLAKTRRQAEDEFAEKKVKWEKELQGRKDELEDDKKELAALRVQVAGFEKELEKAVKEARDNLYQEITEQVATEKKLREQEIKAEKEILSLKISTLLQENGRQAKEIEALKMALDGATAQLKEIAVKVIESQGPTKQPTSPEA